jgi:hypothetical protein
VPRFMVLIKGNEQSEAGVLANAQQADAMGKFNEELVRAGVRVAAEGLQPSSKGARISFSGGQTKVVDGPFAETKEVVGGFWILQCRSLDECVEWIKRAPADALPGGTGNNDVDIYQLYDDEDFA